MFPFSMNPATVTLFLQPMKNKICPIITIYFSYSLNMVKIYCTTLTRWLITLM